MKKCPFCGTKIKDESQGCPHCGYGRPSGATTNQHGEILGEAREVESTTIHEPPPSNQPKNPSSADLEEPNSLWKIAAILLALASFCSSAWIGIIGGIIFVVQSHPKIRRWGTYLLIFCIVLIGLNFLIGAISLFLYFVD